MKRRLLQLSIAALLGASAVTGCGGDGGGDAPRFTAQDVQRRFQELTGLRLEAAPSTVDGTDLRLATEPPDDQVARERFGVFEITVTTDEDALERRQEATSGDPALRVGNVLLEGSDGDEVAAFGRVAAIVRTLGRPLSTVRLAPQDTPCERAGIDPDGGGTRTGTCLVGAQTMTLAPADGTLVLPATTVSKPDTTVSRTVVNRRYGTPTTLRARGRFVLVEVRVENTSNGPLQPVEADLVVDGRRYASYEQDYLSQERHGLQPGERTTASFLFDVPRTAGDPRAGGALEFSASTENAASPERALTIGRIRLR